MTGTLNVKAQPCKNADFPVLLNASGLLPFTRYSVVIGPTSAEPPVTYADWLGSALSTLDEQVALETRTKAPGGTTLTSTFLGPQLGAATVGDHCWLGLFNAVTPIGTDAPLLVVRLADVDAMP